MAATTNYGWTLPAVGGDTGAWGTIVNNVIIAVDAALKAVSNVAAAALAKTGGVMTGKLDMATSSSKLTALGAVSGAVALDLSASQCYTMTIAGNTVFSFTNFPTGAVASAFMLKLTNPGAFTITWPSASPVTQWSNGSVPVFTAVGSDRVAFISDDAGSTVHGVLIGQQIS